MSEALLDPLEAHLDRAELRLARLASHEAVERLPLARTFRHLVRLDLDVIRTP